MKVAIINYGMGNLKSIIGSLNYLGIQDIIVTHDLEEINTCDKIILPGVGAFKEAMKNIKELKLDETLRFNVIEREKPILGICLGMQLMCTFSEEGGYTVSLTYTDVCSGADAIATCITTITPPACDMIYVDEVNGDNNFLGFPNEPVANVWRAMQLVGGSRTNIRVAITIKRSLCL